MASIVAPMQAPLQRRRLTPLSPKNRLALQSLNNVINRQPVTNTGFKKINATNIQPNKRSFALHHDENASLSPKRMKSAPSCSDLVQKPLFVLVTDPSKENAPSDATVNAKKRIQPVNGGIAKVRSLGPPMRIGGQQPTNKGVKRAHARLEDAKVRKPGVKRVDPPKDSNAPISIDAVLKESASSSRAILQPVSRAKESFTWGSGKFPKSWMFNIHEDTLEETLTNLVHHHTGILDISDDEETKKANMSELERKGKENIPPTPDADVIAMPPPPPAPVVAKDDMEAERTRSPLGEVPTEELYPEAKAAKVEPKETKREPSKLRQSTVMTDSPVKAPIVTVTDVEEKVTVVEEVEVSVVESVLETSHDFELDAQTRSIAEDELFA